MIDKPTPEQEYKTKHNDWQRHIDRVRNVVLRHAERCVSDAEIVAAGSQPHNREMALAVLADAREQLGKVQSDLEALLAMKPQMPDLPSSQSESQAEAPPSK